MEGKFQTLRDSERRAQYDRVTTLFLAVLFQLVMTVTFLVLNQLFIMFYLFCYLYVVVSCNLTSSERFKYPVVIAFSFNQSSQMASIFF